MLWLISTIDTPRRRTSRMSSSTRRDSLTLAARQSFDALIDVLNRQQAELGQLLARDALHGLAIQYPADGTERAAAAQFTPQEHVVGNGKARRQRERLINGLDAGTPRIERRVERHLLAVQPDLARIRHHRSGERADQRGFAGAVVADHRENLARQQIEVGVVERDDPAVTLDEAACLQDRR